MARNRQRAKQRQAERRARRLERDSSDGQGRDEGQSRAAEAPPTEVPPVEDPRAVEPAPGLDPGLAVGAPPEEMGRSDGVLVDDSEIDLEDEAISQAEADVAEYEPKGRRGREEEPDKHRSRLVQFLIAVWAELKRVQWPNRQALTTLTGIVLGFTLLAGGYLGLLDAIFSKLINAIL
jgi:preprotein translocase subunit SecE